jgi:formamidopyrimidine-DNA glycosylase
MPELPEVETVRRGLAPAMEGARIQRVELRRADLRFPFPSRFSERLKGARIRSVSRRAKYLLCELETGWTILMHLGMSGSFRLVDESDETVPGNFHNARSAIASHDHVVFHLANGNKHSRIIYNDPRRFGFMDLAETAKLDCNPFLARLGIEPTGNSMSANAIADRLAGKAAPLKAALLDQHLIAGLGNIYVCEALWAAGLSPRRISGTIVKRNGRPSKRCEDLARAIHDVIARAIAAGGSTLRDHRLTDGSLGYFQHSFEVYDRENQPCTRPGCGGHVMRIVQSGRSTFFCPQCQR